MPIKDRRKQLRGKDRRSWPRTNSTMRKIEDVTYAVLRRQQLMQSTNEQIKQIMEPKMRKDE